MNTNLVNSAAGVIDAALRQNRTAAGIALALESAQMLMTPETAAELAAFRGLELADVDGRVSASCPEPGHPTWLRKRDDGRNCPYCRIAELEAERHSTNEALDDAVQEQRTSYAERAQRETHPGRRQAWRMLAQAEESERVANALLTPEAARSADKLTALLAPTQALREDGACTECGDAPSSWCPGCAKCSCVPEHDMGCTGVMGGAR